MSERKLVLRKIILFTICTAILLSVLMQNVTGQRSISISNYEVEFLKGGNQNWDLALDSKQRLFVANNYGLVVLENSSSSIYYLPEKSIVRSVSIIGDKLFTGSFEEFGYWEETEQQQFVYTSLSKQLETPMKPNDEVWKIAALDSTIYFHTFGSIYTYNYSSVRQLPDSFNGHMFLYEGLNELISQKIGGPLVRISTHNLKEIPKPALTRGEELKGVVLLDSITYLFATTLGFYTSNVHSNDVNSFPLKELDEIIAAKINTIQVDENRLIIGTILNGLYVFDKNGNLLHHINSSSGLQNNTILSTLIDTLGNIWVGMDKGLAFVSFNSAIGNYQDASKNIGSVYAAAEFEGQLYVGTNQGVFYFEQESNGNYGNPALLEGTQGQVWFLTVLDETLYIGHTNGTFSYSKKNNNLKKVGEIQGAYTLKEVPNKREFFIQSTYNELAVFTQNNAESQWKLDYVLPEFTMPARYLEIDPFGVLWLGHTIKGVYQVQPSIDFKEIRSRKKMGVSEGLPQTSNRVFKLDNRIIVPSGDSLYVWDSIRQQFIPFTMLDPFFTEKGPVLTISQAGDHRYWIIKKNEILLLEIQFTSVTIHYRLLPQLYDFHLVEGYEKIIALNEFQHLICLDDGFSIIDLRVLNRTDSQYPQVTITQIETVTTNDVLTRSLRSPQENLRIEESESVTFTWKSSLPVGAYRYFQYKLEGFDKDWSSWTNQTQKSYERLASGNYRFLVRTSNALGLASPTPTTFEFDVKSPWYETRFGIFIFMLLSLTGGLSLKLYVDRRQWTKKEQLLAEEKEKMQIEKELTEKALISVKNEKLQAEIEHKSSQLATNTMAIIRKNELLNTIKEELEQLKQELGDRFPKKYFSKLVSLIDSNLKDELEWEAFEQLYDQAHGDFFKRLKEQYPDLTPGDLRLCAYLRMNLASKEIAPLLNISVRGVEERRYRLRKRLNLSADMNLTEMLMTF